MNYVAIYGDIQACNPAKPDTSIVIELCVRCVCRRLHIHSGGILGPLKNSQLNKSLIHCKDCPAMMIINLQSTLFD